MFHHSENEVACAFLEALGATTVLSPPTNRRILERGVSLATDENCLPMKIHLGHVDAIASSVDRVLVPRYASQEAGHDDTCVKMWAAHDITRNVFPDLDVIGYNVDTRFGSDERGAMIRFGRDLGVSRAAARRAWQTADDRRTVERQAAQAAQQKLLDTDTGRPRVLVVGHRYILDDDLMGRPTLSCLGKQDVTVLRSDRVDIERCRELTKALSPTMKWVYNQEQVGAILALRERIDGVVMLVSFPCGPDSLCAELVQRRISELPVCVIVLDELTGTGGLHTRLESFCDIVKMRYVA
jgi:predicted nucleotide-binding protein (sugar kinase/HSP70/actin superfamily)